MTIVRTVKANVLAHPGKIFCHFYHGGACQSLDYAGLWQRASDFAAALRAQEVAPGAVVIIMMRHVPDLYAAFIGTMMHGAVPSFMPPPTAKQEPGLFWKSHRRLFAHIMPGMLIVSAELADNMAEAAAGAPIVIAEAVAAAGAAFDGVLAGDDSDVAFLQHSSGTTGLKKGVMLTHGSVMRHAHNYQRTIGLDAGSVIVSWLPLYHDMGLIACFMLPVLLGSTIVHLDALEWVGNPLSLLDAIEHHAGTHVWIPNFAFNHLALNQRRQRDRRWNLASLIAVINCSEPCKAESMEAFVSAFSASGVTGSVPQVCYAMAETVFAVSQTEPGTPIRALVADRDALLEKRFVPAEAASERRMSLVSCGRPIPGVELRIMDGDSALADGQIGEICITGESMYEGYYRLPDLSAERLVDGWHKSGDLGFLFEGELYVTGRKDDLIIVRGRNFYAHDLEAMITEIDGVKPGRCIVFAIDNPLMGTAEVICLAEPEEKSDLGLLRRMIRTKVESLSTLAIGRVELVPIGRLVKTTSGKISREQNKKLYEDGYFKGTPNG